MVTFSCNDGYRLSGSDSSICVDLRTWSEPTPTCVEGNLHTILLIILNSDEIKCQTFTKHVGRFAHSVILNYYLNYSDCTGDKKINTFEFDLNTQSWQG